MATAKQIWALLIPKQRLEGTTLLGLMLIGAALEMVGIGLVLPALALMTGASHGGASLWFGKVLHVLHNPTRERLVVYGMVTLVGVYTLKSVFLAYVAWRQVRFVYGVQADVSFRLFSRYLGQPYAFHLQRNSALLLRNAINEVYVLCNVLLGPALIFVTEGLVLLGVDTLLIIVEPRGALIVVTTLGLLGAAFHLVTRGPVLRWGAARQLHEGRRIQQLQQGLGGVKDVLVLGREHEFLEQYQADNLGSALASRRVETLQQMPKLGLELLAVVGLALLVIVKLRWGTSVDAILPTIGLFAAAAFRIMPSVSRSMNAMHNVRYALPVLKTLHEELSLPILASAQHSPPTRFEHSVQFLGVTYTYPGAGKPALDRVDLTIARGTTVGFIGGSGAGKSTLVDLLLGLLVPDSGRIEVDGSDIRADRRSWQRNIGYVPQGIFLTDDSLRRNIAFGLPAGHIDDEAVWMAVRAAQLEAYVASLPAGLETVVGERGIRLSGGELQRVGIARALYHNPAVLVLDEATSSLDSATERGVMTAVGALHGQKTVVIVAHRLSTLTDCDSIFRLEGGHLTAQGNVDEMIGSPRRSGSG